MLPEENPVMFIVTLKCTKSLCSLALCLQYVGSYVPTALQEKVLAELEEGTPSRMKMDLWYELEFPLWDLEAEVPGFSVSWGSNGQKARMSVPGDEKGWEPFAGMRN